MNAAKTRGVVFLTVLIMAISGCASMNRYQTEGTLSLPGIMEPVTVLRDEKGMAFIYARNLDDAMVAQGFVSAQDRLFQMELTRLVATGRISELAGEKGKPVDTQMRTIGFLRHARTHADLLSPRAKAFFQKYLDGVNAYVTLRPDTYPLEFKLAGIRPEPWTVADAMAIGYFMSWNSSANLKTEIIAQMLVEKLGAEKAAEIFPLNVNPDDPGPAATASKTGPGPSPRYGFASDPELPVYLENLPLQIGSNNWAVGPQASPGGKPIVANDPHLDARMLPGPWYPCGIVTPELRFVGVGIPGTPGLLIGRNDAVAVGLTNSYGDTQDLYVETVDPGNPRNYMEGNRSVPFEVVEETLKVRDKKAPGGMKEETLRIRLTRRGPVVSGVLPELHTDRVVTMRWAPFEAMEPSMGTEYLMQAKSVREVRDSLRHFNWIGLNFVFADTAGDIGWQASGKLPIRSQREGTLPFEVRDGKDNWTGWIPYEDMPCSVNPERGWVGTCNHLTVGKEYPYYYTSHVANSSRYRRLAQLLDGPGKKPVDDHWRFQRDALNLVAKEVAPVMAAALAAREDTSALAEALSGWDGMDDPEKASPTVFQAVYRHFALLVFQDELGDQLAKTMLGNWYFWQERLQQMVEEGTSPWFDDTRTEGIVETRDALFHEAGLRAVEEMAPKLGRDPCTWLWKKVHRLEFVSPVRRKGFGKGLMGGGSHPMGGSGDTLCRALYDFNAPYDVAISASLRMVADLSDGDKVLAVLPGGVTGRVFAPHNTDQIEAFVKGGKLHWWFSDREIQAHCETTLVLAPR